MTREAEVKKREKGLKMPRAAGFKDRRGATQQGKQATPGSQERQGSRFYSRTFRRNLALPAPGF